ncbi:SGNH/GDSL hydrolase family protein [Fusobacterium perfoetens]|uniref:D-alanyl-lipoteichoic acid biosynthesis protein DltD n=1 Tax=Fusobacterium perfoetens TaxID=852 RepID=UPI001F190E8A|nr:D-alanyl-lipoteichoic acid biosynthesis protein DltD [Fusobacterium perfoetens]MCF2625515.1 SGNH/GDSL hydrolase family protein [Fusobacterium perfoetens]
MGKILILLLISLLLWNFIIIIVNKRKYKKHFPIKIKIFNLGSSHAYFAYDYDEKKKCVNLGDISQTLYYDNIVFDHIYDRIEENAICFLTLSYFSFAGKERWLKEDLIKYYKFLKLKKFKKQEKLECFIYRYLPIIWSIKKKIKKRYLKSRKLSKEERIKGHAKKLETSINKEYNIALIIDILEKCKAKKIKVIFITTPFTEYYNSFFPKELLEKNFYGIILKLSEKYKIRYFDFSHEYEIFNKKEYFDDYDHLSKEGSKVFMQELIKQLKKEGIEI